MRFAAALLLALAGCTEGTPTQTAAPPDKTIAASLAEMDGRISSLKKTVDDLQTKMILERTEMYKLQNAHANAEFDPTETKFQRIDSDIASFAVLITDVSAFGDGVRVKINLGNLSSATISGVTLHAYYGGRQPAKTATESWSKWESGLQNKDVEITTSLSPGSWNPTTVVLPAIEPRNFGYVSLSIDTNTVSMHGH